MTGATGTAGSDGATTDVRGWERTLRRWRREERLYEHLDEICQCLRHTEETTIRRVGQLLLSTPATGQTGSSMRPVTVTVIGTGTVEHIRAHLAGHLLRVGLLPTVHAGTYGQYLAELGTERGGLLDTKPDAVLCLLDARALFEELAPGWGPVQVSEATEEFEARLRGALLAFRQRTNTPVILNTMAIPGEYYAQVLGQMERTRVSVVWRTFTTALLNLSQEIDEVHVLDLEATAFQHAGIYDASLARHARVAYSEAITSEYARACAHLIRAMRAGPSKVLVLDLDDTLWDGTLAEGGVAGLADPASTRAQAYIAVQRAAQQLASQGVLLAVCSKNNHDEVLEAMASYPGCLLDHQDFVTISADWTPKAIRVPAIAEQLNLATEAVVFADDNVGELGGVAMAAPTIATIAMDADEPANNLWRLLRDGWFTTLTTTAEDRKRTALYQAEQRRSTARQRVRSYEDHLRSLETQIVLTEPAEEEWPRVSQMTLRTNQCNLTTVRLRLAEVLAYRRHSHRRVLVARANDRFGDYGIVACLFISDVQHQSMTIDNLVMSCRVMGRGIEQALVAALVRDCLDRGCSVLRAMFRPAARNQGMVRFLTECGFTETDTPSTWAFENSAGQQPRVFQLDPALFTAAPYTAFVSLSTRRFDQGPGDS
jgi:FkbH-like protein